MKVSVTPVPKPRMTRRDRWAQRPVVARYWAFCDELRAATEGLALGGRVSLDFVLPMPVSWSRVKRARLDGTPHEQRPDIDNLCKAVFDALYTDDKVIHELRATKRWGVVGSITIRTETAE